MPGLPPELFGRMGRPLVFGPLGMAEQSNILNKLSKAVHGRARSMIHDIWMAETRAAARKAFDFFAETFEAKYPEAVECLKTDRDVLLKFHDFPA